MATENKLIKKAHQTDTYTEDQLKEFAKCADPVNGPAYFMNNYFHIQHPKLGKALYKAYPYQEKLIEVYHNYRRSISLLSRQSGKCIDVNTTIKIRHNNTGEMKNMTIGEFFEQQKRKTIARE